MTSVRELIELADAASGRQDQVQAVKWYRLAAEKGDGSAQFTLGYMYEVSFGPGVPQDYAEALKWYRLAAEQGHTSAQQRLGYMYDRGRGVAQDYAVAIEWHRLAAEQGDTSAQRTLGFSYYFGGRLPRDDVQAMKWFTLSAASGDDRTIEERNKLAARMKPAQIAKAQKLASEWRPKAWSTLAHLCNGPLLSGIDRRILPRGIAMKFFEVVTFIGAAFGALTLLVTIVGAESAPQQAAGSAIAVALAIIPYVVVATLHRREQRKR